MADALGAQIGIDNIDCFARVDRLVWTNRLTHIAVDTRIGDLQRHVVLRVLARDLAAQSRIDIGRHKLVNVTAQNRDFTHQTR